MGDRWKYKTEAVSVGDNTLQVRGLTFGERVQFLAKRKEIKEGKAAHDALGLTKMAVKMGCVEPPLSDEEIESMPGDLFAAAVERIIELSGMKEEKKSGSGSGHGRGAGAELTGEQRLVCLVAGYLGCSPTEVLELPAVDLDLLATFYTEEPWGAWRDNLHAAMIARELRVTRTGKRAALDDFIYMQPDRRRRRNLTGLVDALKAMAGGHRKHISEYKPPKRGKRDRPGKTGSTPRSAVRAVPPRARKGKPPPR